MQVLNKRKTNKKAVLETNISWKKLENPTAIKGKMSEDSWKGKKEFFLAQAKVALVLAVARIGDQWEPSYPRNDNHNMALFWAFHVVLFIAAAATWTYVPPRDPSSDRVTLLSDDGSLGGT